ncbi:MAG: tRNA (adenosine(37)-N6)-threonylcarbamoyltransferase complex dimerization subunit type 1 TsaB [Candidatus Eremiobacteraeota bacterium]|nr:tRNA (adenosine(37)-N6)-threonylcarbamoyltransferase complex dimerization subunit type 1 TsaB [Candidatus Eremiobacteraeota bacterium]
MWILGIDTCTETMSVGLLGDNQEYEMRETAPKKQLIRLTQMISEILDHHDLNISDISAIAITRGPGSFTGTRLGIVTVKTLSQVMDIPLAPIQTLDALASGVKYDGIVIPSMDARKNEVFFAVYEKKNDKFYRIGDYRKKHIDDYIKFVNELDINSLPLQNREIAEKPLLIAGSIFFRYEKRLDDELNVEFIKSPEESRTPHGLVIARMGKEMVSAGKTVDFLHLAPEYMRGADATPPTRMPGEKKKR